MLNTPLFKAIRIRIKFIKLWLKPIRMVKYFMILFLRYKIYYVKVFKITILKMVRVLISTRLMKITHEVAKKCRLTYKKGKPVILLSEIWKNILTISPEAMGKLFEVGRLLYTFNNTEEFSTPILNDICDLGDFKLDSKTVVKRKIADWFDDKPTKFLKPPQFEAISVMQPCLKRKRIDQDPLLNTQYLAPIKFPKVKHTWKGLQKSIQSSAPRDVMLSHEPILIEIFLKLPTLASFASASAVCKKWREVAEKPQVLHHFALKLGYVLPATKNLAEVLKLEPKIDRYVTRLSGKSDMNVIRDQVLKNPVQSIKFMEGSKQYYRLAYIAQMSRLKMSNEEQESEKQKISHWLFNILQQNPVFAKMNPLNQTYDSTLLEDFPVDLVNIFELPIERIIQVINFKLKHPTMSFLKILFYMGHCN
jgi:hypothetical protein